MDTNRIRYFLSLAQTGSITEAAKLHHISPAAFSKSMRIFSEELGQKLLIPHGRGILLTDHAKSLVPAFLEIILKLDHIKDSSRHSKNLDLSINRWISVATFEVFSTYFFEKVLSTVLKDYSCNLFEMIPGKMESAVASGVADLALTYIPVPHQELDFLKLTEIEMGIFGHPDAELRSDYRELPFAVPISPIEGSPNKVRGLDGWPDDAFPRNIRYRVQMLESALGLCRRKMAYAYIPKFVARLHNETVKTNLALKEIKLPRGFTEQRSYVYLVKRKSDHEGVEAKKIASAVRQICSIS
jgi:DNA-binding transcriptional LysR family regulator